MSDPDDAFAVRAVARLFSLPGEVGDVAPHGSGHINRTFLGTIAPAGAGAPERFVFQQINEKIFRDVPGLMDNIRRITAHAPHVTPALVPARAGGPFARDAAGAAWRVYRFVAGAQSRQTIESPAQAREVARAFGAFQQTLATLPGPRLHEVLPGFHDTRQRYAALHEAIAADATNRAADARDEIAFALAREAEAGVLLDLHATGALPERVVHNDCKLNNLLLDAAGRAVCVLDLETTMPGFAPCDFGDMVRTASCAAAEDERDLARVAADPTMLRALAEGYLYGAGALLTDAEIEHLAFAGRLLALEQGVRFLADHLNGDTYYRIHRPGHNLDRARAQFALVRSLEARHAEFERTIAELAALR
jgi:aminoglycoside phosphotransferase (APT) family kinase protein